LTALNKTSALLIQTSHVRPLKVCDVSCSIVSTCASNRREINLNICFASAFPYKIELKRYPVHTPKSLTLRRLMSYIYIYMEHPFLMFLDHTQRRSTVGRTPLDE